MREIVVGLEVKIPHMKESLVVVNEHLARDVSDDEESEDSEWEDVFDTVPDTRDEGHRESKEHVHRHTEGERECHELHFCVGTPECGVTLSFFVRGIFGNFLSEEDKMKYTKENQSDIREDDCSLKVDVSSTKCCRYRCYSRNRSLMFGEEHQDHKKGNSDTSSAESVQEVERFEWVFEADHNRKVIKIRKFFLTLRMMRYYKNVI